MKVFILAGQSNMEGYGAIHEVDPDGNERKGTLTRLIRDPARAAKFKHLREDRPAAGPEVVHIEATNANFGDSAPNRRKKLKLVYRIDGQPAEKTIEEGETLTLEAKPGQLTIEKAIYGDLPDGDAKDVTAAARKLVDEARSRERWRVRDDVWVWFEGRKGNLTTGFGAHPNLFGPELQFGHVLGDALDDQVLIIKTAWGGKSLYRDFRPPGSGGTVGPNYRLLIETVRKVLSNLKAEFPAYDGRGFELAGLVWWHGWNDGIDPAKAVPEYEMNLVNLIKDLRRDLSAPRLPVVIAELTGPWVQPTEAGWIALRQAQRAAAEHPRFKGNVVFVETRDFVRKEEDSPGGWPAHEFNNAETYFLVGNACAEAMKKLVPTRGAAAADPRPR